MFKKTEDYYFSPTALTISQSPYQGDSDYLIVSVRNGSKIRLSGLVPTANPLYDGNSGYNRKIGYNVDNLDAREWTFTGGNIKLSSAYKDLPLYIYIRLDASLLGTTGELFFSRNNYDFDGYPIPMGPKFDGKFTEEGEPAYSIPNLYSGNEKDYLESIANVDTNAYINVAAEDLPSPKDQGTRFFVCIGTLSDGTNGTRTWLPWNTEAKGGTFLTDLATEKGDDGLFYLDNQLINQKYPFSSVITRALHLGSWTKTERYEGAPLIKEVLSSANKGRITEWFTDKYLATTAFIRDLFEGWEDKFLRKDQPDTTPYTLTVGKLVATPTIKEQKKDADGNLLYYATDESGNATSEETTEETDFPVMVETQGAHATGAIEGGTLKLAGVSPQSDESVIPTLGIGNFSQGESGAAIWIDSQGYSHIETDYANFRESMTAKSVEIEDVYHVGGQMLLTSASCIADMVVPYYQNGSGYSPNPPSPESGVGAAPAFYRVYFLRQDQTDKIVQNKWKVRDQAYCNQFNLESPDGAQGSHRYWRLVIGTDNPTNLGITSSVGVSDVFEIDSVEYNSSDYHYIDLSNRFGETEAYQWMQSAVMDAPLPEDNIVQYGYNTIVEGLGDGFHPTDRDKVFHERSNAIMIAGAGDASPYITEYTNIHWWTDKDSSDVSHHATIAVDLRPGKNKFVGSLEITGGRYTGDDWEDFLPGLPDALDDLRTMLGGNYQTLQDLYNKLKEDLKNNNEQTTNLVEQLNKIEGFHPNLIRNSGFIGDYISTQVWESLELAGSSLVNANHLAYWSDKVVNARAWSGMEDDPMYQDGKDEILKQVYLPIAQLVDSRNIAVLGDASSGQWVAGELSQKLYYALLSGEMYAMSFYARKDPHRGDGTESITVTVGNISQEFVITDDWQRYHFTSVIEGQTKDHFILSGQDIEPKVSIRGICCISCLQLEKADKPTAWAMSFLDNASVMGSYQSLMYLGEALNNNTKTQGGLVLTSLIRLGYSSSTDPAAADYWDNWQATAGVSGITGTIEKTDGSINVSADAPAFWAGGDLSEANETIRYYHQNHTGTPTPSQLRSQASIVLTHGGRAILNDAIVRGGIYADFGTFHGDVYANNLYLGTNPSTSDTVFGTNGQLIAKNADISGTVKASAYYYNIGQLPDATYLPQQIDITLHGAVIMAYGYTLILPDARTCHGLEFTFIGLLVPTRTGATAEATIRSFNSDQFIYGYNPNTQPSAQSGHTLTFAYGIVKLLSYDNNWYVSSGIELSTLNNV